MGTRPLAAIAVVFAISAVAACGGQSATARATTTAPPATAAPATAAPTSAGGACTSATTPGQEVLIAGFEYQPAELTIPAGSAVAWTNDDADAHTVTFDDGPDCGRMAQGISVALQFDSVGTFSYFCAFHPNMRGTITVE